MAVATIETRRNRPRGEYKARVTLPCSQCGAPVTELPKILEKKKHVVCDKPECKEANKRRPRGARPVDPKAAAEREEQRRREEKRAEYEKAVRLLREGYSNEKFERNMGVIQAIADGASTGEAGRRFGISRAKAHWIWQRHIKRLEALKAMAEEAAK